MSLVKITLSFWVSVCSLACVTWVASADHASAQASLAAPSRPQQCSDRAKLSAKYDAGSSAGQQKADAFFASADVAKSPKKLQNKIGRMLERLHGHIREAMQQDTSDGRRCRVQGVVDGFIYRIVQLAGQCVLDGAQWGQFTSELYCELSSELGGLAASPPLVRAPVGLCGTLFEQVCDAAYAYVATEGDAALAPSVQRFLKDRGLTLTPYAGCGEFTKGAFEDVFESSVQSDCAYSAP